MIHHVTNDNGALPTDQTPGTQANEVDKENPEEHSRRVNRIGRVLQLLEERPQKFHIALIGKNDEQLFGWNMNTNRTTVSWMIKDSDNPHVGIESKYCLPSGYWCKARMMIYSPCVDDSFKDTFQFLWDKLPASSKDRAEVIQILRNLQKRIEERERTVGRSGLPAE